MPAKITDPEKVAEMVERTRERNRRAQATWVAKNHEEHLSRMREQYAKKKAAASEKKMMEFEAKTPSEKIVALKKEDPSLTQEAIAEQLKFSQSKVSRVLAKERKARETLLL